MEKEIETTIMGYIGYILGLYRDNGKARGNYYRGYIIRIYSPNAVPVECSPTGIFQKSLKGSNGM